MARQCLPAAPELHTDPGKAEAGHGSGVCPMPLGPHGEKQAEVQGSQLPRPAHPRGRAHSGSILSTHSSACSLLTHREALTADPGQAGGNRRDPGPPKSCVLLGSLHAHLSDSATSSQSKMQAGPPDQQRSSKRPEGKRGPRSGARTFQAAHSLILPQVPAVWP